MGEGRPAFWPNPPTVLQGGYWEAKAAQNFEATGVTDIYDVSPVVSKDLEAAEAYQKALPPSYRGVGAGLAKSSSA